MRWLFAFLFAAWLLLCRLAAEGEVCKVLPQFLDLKGNATVSPSLFDRDAYQSMLRHNPGKRGGFRFCVQWKVKSPETGNLKLRVKSAAPAGPRSQTSHRGNAGKTSLVQPLGLFHPEQGGI